MIAFNGTVSSVFFCSFFFFQAEDGIRDLIVTGVQTCALPIFLEELLGLERNGLRPHIFSMRQPTDAVCHDANRAVRAPVTYLPPTGVSNAEIGRASCRERV